MTDSEVVSIKNLSFSYNSHPALEDVSLTINHKDFVWVVGPNGGGKTTLLRLILGLLHPQRGTIKVLGEEPSQARSDIGYMPQFAQLDDKFPISVFDVTLMGRLGNGHTIGPFRNNDRKIAEKTLKQVGLYDLRQRRFSALSGGQQRRLLIARALASEPKLLLLDEPTANLDQVAEKELFELLRQLNERLTIILVSHEPAFVLDFVKRVVCVNRHVTEHPTSAVDGEFMGDLYRGELRMVRHDRHVHEKERGESDA